MRAVNCPQSDRASGGVDSGCSLAPGRSLDRQESLPGSARDHPSLSPSVPVVFKLAVVVGFLTYVVGLLYARLSPIIGYSISKEFLVPAVTLAFFLFALGHCVAQMGIRRASTMVFITLVITLGSELLGTSTGIIFGSYHYTDALGLKFLGLVPLALPQAWFMMIYCSYCVANVLGRGLDARPSSGGSRVGTLVATTIIGAAAMTAWDLSLDPVMVSLGFWVWHSPGGYFGIPFSNYVGWFITAFVVLGTFRVVDARLWSAERRPPDSTPGRRVGFVFDLLPLLAYWIQWIDGFVLPWQLGQPRVAVVATLVMGLFVASTAIRVVQGVRVPGTL